MNILKLKLLVAKSVSLNKDIEKTHFIKNGILINTKKNKYFKLKIKEISADMIPEAYKTEYKED